MIYTAHIYAYHNTDKKRCDHTSSYIGYRRFIYIFSISRNIFSTFKLPKQQLELEKEEQQDLQVNFSVIITWFLKVWL
jgi:hypothetical protein